MAQGTAWLLEKGEVLAHTSVCNSSSVGLCNGATFCVRWPFALCLLVTSIWSDLVELLLVFEKLTFVSSAWFATFLVTTVSWTTRLWDFSAIGSGASVPLTEIFSCELPNAPLALAFRPLKFVGKIIER